ncbi:hypothetical protein AUJ69_02375 [Candidatus Woesearchaeota archaeon CG1_02_47_18]|nr:MAG: hypothetical protein AUJ69_02375 [Candidatus Woesearchaeota archaeon CG1_02_47_18]
MEVKVIEETKKRLVVEVPGAGHTLCNLLKNQLLQNKHVRIATYVVKHPLVAIPTMIIETDGKTSPRKALYSVVDKLTDDFKDLKKKFLKAVK